MKNWDLGLGFDGLTVKGLGYDLHPDTQNHSVLESGALYKSFLLYVPWGVKECTPVIILCKNAKHPMISSCQQVTSHSAAQTVWIWGHRRVQSLIGVNKLHGTIWLGSKTGSEFLCFTISNTKRAFSTVGGS